MVSKVWYKCDPNKNTQCSKSGCKQNKEAIYPVCDLTSHKEFSVDGIPMQIIMSDGKRYKVEPKRM